MRECLDCEQEISLDSLYCDFTGYLTGSLEDARREHELRGGYLFRMGDLYLVCCHGEALGWGWTEDELRALPCKGPVASGTVLLKATAVEPEPTLRGCSSRGLCA
jgi:hypothetical protein